MAKACSHCHGALSETDQNFSHAYDKIDIPPVKPVVTRVEIDQGVCPCCRTATPPAVVPEGCEPGTPFSLTIVVLAIYLRFIQNISYQRLACLFRDLFGLVLSVGALDAMLQRAKPCFDREVTAILARLRRSRVVYSDETSIRIDGINGWNWVFQNDEIVLHTSSDQVGAMGSSRKPSTVIDPRCGCRIYTGHNRAMPINGRSALPISCGIAGTPSRPETWWLRRA